MSSKKSFLIFIALSAVLLAVAAGIVIYIDPFFHYHLPHTDRFFYTLDNERSQNNGLLKHFDYDAVITGNSMAENFKATEVNEIFGVNAMKATYMGGTFYEINSALELALETHPDVKVVIRALDMARFFEEAEILREDLGDYPDYLYNDNPFDDVKYFWNKDVLGRCYAMIRASVKGEPRGMTPLDLHGYWMPGFVGQFGKNTLLAGHAPFEAPVHMRDLFDDERERIERNVERNVIALCREYPDTVFYYFITPYSAVWYGDQRTMGTLNVYINGEAQAIRQILENGPDNLKLFSYNMFTDITTNLDNYKDAAHYGEWINSQILHYMHDGAGLLTKDNYEEYIRQELEFYNTFDYNSLFMQEDQEDRPSDYSW